VFHSPYSNIAMISFYALNLAFVFNLKSPEEKYKNESNHTHGVAKTKN
jgi:hypothetical protein